MRERYKSLAKDTMLFGVSSFVSKIMIFLLLPIYTGVLSTEEYGRADIIINLVNLLYPLLTLSIVEAVLRYSFISEVRNNELILSSLSIILLDIIILLSIAFSFSAIGYVKSSNIYLFILLFAGYSLQNLFASFCRGSGRKKLFAIQGIIQTVSLLVYNLLFLLVLRMGMAGYLMATISAYLTAVIYMIYKGKLYEELFPLKINIVLIKDMLKYSIPLIPAMMMWWINSSADKYTIIGLVGIGASGVYAAAHKIPTILTAVSDIFNQAFLISAVNNINDDDSSIYFKNISRYFLILNFLGCSVLIAFSEIVAKILFSEEYIYGWVYIPILILAAMFSSLSAYLASFYRAIKNSGILFGSTLIGAIINVILNFVLIKLLGTIGAAYATAISFGVVFIIRNYYSNKLVQLDCITKKSCVAGSVVIVQAILISLDFKSKYYISIIAIFAVLLIFYKDMKNIMFKVIKRT